MYVSDYKNKKEMCVRVLSQQYNKSWYKYPPICQDFGTTLDLFASKKANSGVDNHAFLCTFFFLIEWRTVQCKKATG
eukprot:1266420-Ditylum_brightwellii.AAC.1